MAKILSKIMEGGIILWNHGADDDRKDAGDMGSGHSVTALYGLVPHRVKLKRGTIDPLKHQQISFRLAAAVAQFGMVLRKSEGLGGTDEEKYRSQFAKMIKLAMALEDTARQE